MKLIMNKTKRNVMRKYIIYIASFVGSALLQTGCYDDKGDYDYHDVNTMAIVIPETKVRMPKEEAVEISIIPEISQTLEQNEENLVFQWKIILVFMLVVC